MPTIQAIDTFDHTIDAGYYSDGFFGTPTGVSSPLYQTRQRTLQIDSAGANEGVRYNFTGSPTRGWVGVPLQVPGSPTGGGLLFFEIHTAGGERAQIRFSGAGNIYAHLGADDSTSVALTAGSFHWVELIFDVSGTTHTAYWRLDGSDQDTVASNPGSASTCDYVQLLSETTDGTLTWYAGGYWVYGSASSITDWLGEPSAPVGGVSFMSGVGW